ncbi:zinc finger BED domain-containing protein 4-like [Nothobranchius furzeri]|uniref:Zinc finger BED domain-containing protein 4-like n=1 Tax=Nothobranchius furzeri TaxID=105023 RepID=A0A9D2Y853_NOTFU|nr:zinc finger BED domain-containing protein 4-like [Nothobranchius furzeri]
MLPGRKYFADVALPELHQTVYSFIEGLLKESVSSSVSFTSDIWSSDVSPVSMLSLTAAADVIPSVLVLKRLLAKDAAADHGVKTTKATLLEAVSKRFADIEKEPLYSLATIIDPRYKDKFYSEDAVKIETHRQLLRLITKASQRDPNQEAEASNTGPPAEKVPRPGSFSSMFGEILAEETPRQAHTDTPAGPAPSEMIVYLSEPPIPRSASPLAFWKTNKERFPDLAKVAQAYLSAPCTSVESERLFSAASNILVDEHRNRLMTEKAEMLLFIKKNLPMMLLNKSNTS